MVDFENCCKTRIFFQKSVPIQPKTSEILPKFCKKLATIPTVPASGEETPRTSSSGLPHPTRGSAAMRGAARDLPAPVRVRGRRGKIGKILQIFGGLVRLYQNEILQENMRLTAFFKLYKICILLHRCNLKNLAESRFENSAISMKIQKNFCKSLCREFAKFQKLQLDNLVDFEKC